MTIIKALILFFILSGCASQLTEDEQYERKNKIAETRDEILELERICVASGNFFVYHGPMQGNRVRHANARRKGTIYISRHADPSEYRCVKTIT